jgi:hypothetical protein
VLRRIFGPKPEKVTGERRNLHNEEIRNLYKILYGDQTMKSERGGSYSTHGGDEKCTQKCGLKTTWETIV